LPPEPPIDPFRDAAEAVSASTSVEQRLIDMASEPWPAVPATGRNAEWFISVFKKWEAIEAASLAYYRAKTIGQEPPYIRDGVVRYYAYVMGQTVTWRDRAPTADHRRLHEGAISSFHSCIREWQTYREAHGLPIEYTLDDTTKAHAALSPLEQMAVTRKVYQHGASDPA
jgi:hypothetical protein